MLLFLTTLFAYFIKGLSGFANTLILTSILSFSINNISISPLDLLLGWPSNIILMIKERKYLKYEIWLPLSIMVIAGSIPGIYLLKNLDAQYIKVIFAFVIIALGIEMLFREHTHNKKSSSKKVLLSIGILSGLLCGLFGIGALLAAYIGRTSTNTHEFKSNLCLVFAIENTFRIVMYTISGILNYSILITAIKLVPFMLIGLFIGIKCSDKIPERVAKHLVIIILIITGIMLLIKNLNIL